MASKTKAAHHSEKREEKRKIPIEKLRRSCVKLFGVTPSTFDGATVGLAGEFTVAEMQAHIDKWLNMPVSLGQRKEG